MAKIELPESDGQPSSPFVAANLDIRQVAIELGAELSLLVEQLTTKPIELQTGLHPRENVAKAVEVFAEEVRLLNARYCRISDTALPIFPSRSITCPPR